MRQENHVFRQEVGGSCFQTPREGHDLRERQNSNFPIRLQNDYP